MQLITSAMLESFVNEQKRKMEGVLPELVRRLIVQSCPDIKYLRMPQGDDIWASGFDGIVYTKSGTSYVSCGCSIWEFGTNSDMLKKINEDYEKRTNDPKGVNQGETVFYLVTPKIWAYATSATEWEASHKGPWKEVHVYDASVLCNWINSEPAVCAWLLEQFTDKTSKGFTTVHNAWTRFSNLTDPPLSHSLFALGRDEAVQQLQNQLTQKICCVRGDTFYDAIGFCLTVLLQDPKLADSVIVVSKEETYRTLSEIVRGKTFLLQFPFSGQVSDNNNTIICQSREQTPRYGTIRLHSLWRSQFDRALRDMNLPASQASELYTFTHGNLLSLIRRIPGNAADTTPKWASMQGIDILCPLVFLRNFNTTSETARRVFSMLAGIDAAIVQQKYDELLRMEDTPIKRVDEWLIITNYEESWLTLHIDLSDTSSGRLFQTILTLLKEFKEGTHSEFSDEGALIGTLLFNYIYFAQTGSSENHINSQVREILDYMQYQNCQTVLLQALPDLAEAAPTVVVDWIERLLSPAQQALFEQLSRSYKSHVIVWALEHLVKDQRSAIKACALLFYLTKTQALDSFGVSAREVLLNTLCLWDNHTPIFLREKVTILEKSIRSDPPFGISLTLDILQKRSIVHGVRIGAVEHTYEEATVEELRNATMRIASTALTASISHKELELTMKMLGQYWMFSVETLSEAAQQFEPIDYSQEKLVSFLLQLHQHIFHIIKHHKDERTRWIDPLRGWITRITKDNAFLQVAWMFSAFSETPFQNTLELDIADFRAIESHAQAARVEAFNKLKDSMGLDAALQLIQNMDDCYAWGQFLAHCLADDELSFAIKAIMAQHKHRVLTGFIDSIPLVCAESLFFSLTDEVQHIVLSGLSRSDIRDWLKTPELQRSYWQKKNLYSIDDWAYENLMKYHPSGILSYLYQCQNEKTGIDDRLLEVFHAIATIREAYDRSLLELIIRKVDAYAYSDQWAEQCIQLVEADVLELHRYDGYYPECLKKYFFLHPTSISEIFLKNKELFSKLFSYSFQLPNTAFSDYQQFRVWSDCIYEGGQKNPSFFNILCDAFVKVSVGSDGFFPHEYVRMALEEYADPNLTKAVFISYLNSRGARVVLDGLYEKQMAEKTLQKARELQLDYPQTASILRYISNDYTAESRRDQLYAEIGHFR